MNILHRPKSAWGKTSVSALIAFILSFTLLNLLIAMGQRGGQEFFDNLMLAIPGLLAGIAGILSFVSGLPAIIAKHERSALVLISTLIGAFVTFFVLGEILFPH